MPKSSMDESRAGSAPARCPGQLAILHDDRFGNFQFKVVRRQLVFRPGCGRCCRSNRVVELDGRQIEGQQRGAKPSSIQARSWAQALCSTRVPISPIRPLSGDRNEVGRAEQALAGMLPADQGFVGGGDPGFQVDDRLIVHHEFLAVDGAPQVGFDLEIIVGGGIHLRREVAVGIPAVGFGLIHRRIGIAHQRVYGDPVVRVETDADGGVTNSSCPSIRMAGRRASSIFEASLPAMASLFFSGRTIMNCRRRAAPTISLARRVLVRRLATRLSRVSPMMAERIVDGLEAVQIDEQDGQLGLVLGRGIHGFAEALLEQRAVGQAGQCIVMGEIAQLALDAAALEHSRSPVRWSVP